MYFERAGTREWSLPPPSYAQSSVPAALSRVNALLMSNWQHADQPNLKQDNTVINDQLLIKVTKTSDSEESPTPEGVHQDGTEVSSVTMIERKGVQVARATRRHPPTRTGAPHASPATHHMDAHCVQRVAAWPPTLLIIPPNAFSSRPRRTQDHALDMYMCSTPSQHGGESRFWSLDAPTGNYDGIGTEGQPIAPPAGFSWSHSLANITLEQPWESLFFVDRKVRRRPPRVLLPYTPPTPPAPAHTDKPAPGPCSPATVSSLSQRILSALTRAA